MQKLPAAKDLREWRSSVHTENHVFGLGRFTCVHSLRSCERAALLMRRQMQPNCEYT